MKNTIIYFVRHGEVNNPEKIIYGRLPDFSLSKLGEFQAQLLKKFFANENVSNFFSSPLYRAKETTKIITNGKKIIYDKRLLEIDIKDWEGMKRDDRPKKDVEIYTNHPDKFIGHGETVSDVVKRTEDFINFAIKKYPGQKIVVVCHGEVIAAAQVVAGMIPFKKINIAEIRHASITRLEFDRELKCIKSEYFTIAPAGERMI